MTKASQFHISRRIVYLSIFMFPLWVNVNQYQKIVDLGNELGIYSSPLLSMLSYVAMTVSLVLGIISNKEFNQLIKNKRQDVAVRFVLMTLAFASIFVALYQVVAALS